MKIKAIVKEDFNDKENNLKKVVAGKEIIVTKERYDELFSKGKVEKGIEIKEEKKSKKDKED